jgi:hypothetical protein
MEESARKRVVLSARFQNNRGLGLPAGTVIILERTPSGVTVVDYTTPHGAYGGFVASGDNEVDKLLAACIPEPTGRSRRGRGRSRGRGR